MIAIHSSCIILCGQNHCRILQLSHSPVGGHSSHPHIGFPFTLTNLTFCQIFYFSTEPTVLYATLSLSTQWIALLPRSAWQKAPIAWSLFILKYCNIHSPFKFFSILVKLNNVTLDAVPYKYFRDKENFQFSVSPQISDRSVSFFFIFCLSHFIPPQLWKR